MKSSTRGWVIGLGVLNVVLFLTFVGALLLGGTNAGTTRDDASDSDVAQTPPEESSTPEQTAQTSQPPAAEETTTPPEGETLAPPPEGALDLASFTMPSRNIACTLTQTSVACTIASMSFTPPAGEDCPWRGQIVVLDVQGVSLPCPPEAPATAAQDVTVLDYGQSTVVGPWLCTSSQSGVECSSRADGTAFSLARASLSTSGPGALA